MSKSVIRGICLKNRNPTQDSGQTIPRINVCLWAMHAARFMALAAARDHHQMLITLMRLSDAVWLFRFRGLWVLYLVLSMGELVRRVV